MQVSQQFLQEHPDLEITYSNFPLEPWKSFLISAIGYSMWVAIALLFFGDTIFEKLGVEPPFVYTYIFGNEDVRNSRMLVAIGLFWAASFLSQNLGSTGAFEIYYDQMPVYSKLALRNNRVVLDDILKSFRAAMKKAQQG